MSSWILGINGSHNGSYCLLEGRHVRVAIQEERLIGLKRARAYGGRRSLGIQYCLNTAGITLSDLSMIVLSSQLYSKAEENDLGLNPDLRGLSHVPKRIVSHHLAHAASAVAMSGYESTAVLVADGAGSPVEDLNAATKALIVDFADGTWEHLSLFHACRSKITPLEIHTSTKWMGTNSEGMRQFFSLGGLFSAVAQQIFGERFEAGKVMGMAPYGTPRIPLEEFVQFDGNRIHFPNLVQKRFQHNERWPAHEHSYQDLAASAQHALEVTLLHFITRLHAMTHESNLCLAGGTALNSIANQRICIESGFDSVYIIPAAEDSGVAIGAAFIGLWELEGHQSISRVQTDSYGRTAAASEIHQAIRAVPDIDARQPADFLDEVADRLRDGQMGGWFQGGAELGPRALGQRSIVCSPCGKDTKDLLNVRVKFREPFRPFAPSVLAAHAEDWFDFGCSSRESPFMLRVVPFRKDRCDRVPAVVHVDGTGRLQTLTPKDNGRFHDLVARFHDKTGIPMVLNTSLNIRGEPIAETPTDALWCLLGTGLDFCVIHDWIITKSESFRTILDYIPAVVASEYTLQMEISNNSLQTTVRREDAVRVHISTPWGDTNVILPIRLFPLLSNVDGRRNGHALLRGLADYSSSDRIVRDLLLLRRMHIIKFFHPPPHD